MDMRTPKVLLEGIVFPEGPRWHDGKLWFSDMHGGKVMTVDPDGRSATVVAIPERPSGLGFDRSGNLLIVSMGDRRLVRLRGGALETVADLAPFVGGDPNDMVVDGQGRAYIGNFGFDLFGGGSPRPTNLLVVAPHGGVRVVADEVSFPNGTVITPDGKTLIVAETFAGVLTAFNVKPDGSLSGRRFFAHLGDRQPDGICLDAEGAVWASCFGQDEFVRVHEGGEIADRVAVTGRRAVACMLGGEDRKTLFLLTAETSVEDLAQGKSKGRIETVRVDVPGAGYP
ncbi:MAG: SMP-30/gluconolactonase/LRE family protein [Candidatus Binatia bacterium]